VCNTCVDGVSKKLLDFVEENDESSAGVADMLTTALTKSGLNVHYIGKSVFTALQALDPNIRKANCNTHIVHNTLHKIVDVMDCDVETIVTATYSHFSISANRRIELENFFAFVDLEFHDLLMHVSTRWLSRGPTIDKLLQSRPAL
jgi:hypothetical protein